MPALFFAKLGSIFFAVSPTSCSGGKFFFFPSWWEYLDGQTDPLGTCSPLVHFPGDIWLIGLAVLDMLVRLAGFIAVISIIVAGVELITSQGNSEKGAAARNRLINSLVGLAIAIIAVGIVAFIGNTIAGGQSPGQALPHTSANQTSINTILNIAFVILGALAFLFIVIAGFRFVMSRGDPAKLADARRQIVYAAIGLILVAFAAAIVNLVIGKLLK